MTDLFLGCTVMTPNGLGIVQGQEIDNDGHRGRIIVSHDPASPDLPSEYKPAAVGIWVLLSYDIEQLNEVRINVVPKKRR